jgi:hypothetical protein
MYVKINILYTQENEEQILMYMLIKHLIDCIHKCFKNYL